MSFVLQPFNYFDTDPSQNVDDAVNVLAVKETSKLVYKRQGDLDDRGDVITRDLDCLPVMVRRSAAAAAADYVNRIVMLLVVLVVAVCDYHQS